MRKINFKIIRLVFFVLSITILLLIDLIYPPKYVYAQTSLLSGRVYNTTQFCKQGSEKLTIQFIGPIFSTSISIEPSVSMPLSLPKQLYKAITQNVSGEILEITDFLVTEENWIFYFGCNFPDFKNNSFKEEYRKIYNTTDSCSKEEEIFTFINGKYTVALMPSEDKKAYMPLGITVFEVMDKSKNKRLFLRTKDLSKNNNGFFYGCRNPFFNNINNGISAILYNTTDTCIEWNKKISFIMRIDGENIASLDPGKKIITKIEKGFHLIELINNESGESLLKEEKNLQKPFKFHYGCEKPNN